MTWTYDSTAPGSSAKSWVRMRIADTTSGDQQLTDEEINAFIDDGGNKYMGAALAAESLAAKYARKADKTAGKLSLRWNKVSDNYLKLATTLRQSLYLTATPYAGGISESDMDTNEEDTDRPTPDFERGQFDNVQLSNSSTDRY